GAIMAKKSNRADILIGHVKAKARIKEAEASKKKTVKTASKVQGKGKNPNSIKNLKKFKKGQSGNPLGGQLHDPVKRALKKITKETYNEIIEIALTGTPQDLIERILDPSTTVIEKILIEALLKASESGNLDKLEQVLERLIGKV